MDGNFTASYRFATARRWVLIYSSLQAADIVLTALLLYAFPSKGISEINPLAYLLLTHSFLFLIAAKLLITLVVDIAAFWLTMKEPGAWLTRATLKVLWLIMAFVVAWNLALLIYTNALS